MQQPFGISASPLTLSMSPRCGKTSSKNKLKALTHDAGEVLHPNNSWSPDLNQGSFRYKRNALATAPHQLPVFHYDGQTYIINLVAKEVILFVLLFLLSFHN